MTFPSRIPRAPFAAAALAASLTVAACSATPSVDDELRRDLDAAVGSTIELPPQRSEAGVMSAIELGAAPAPAESRAAVSAPPSVPKAPVRTARATTPPPAAPAPSIVLGDPSDQPAAMDEPAPVEQQAPVPAAKRPVEPAPRGEGTPPPGGWKTMDEMIRKAPFPINP